MKSSFALGEDAGDGSEMQPAIAKADAQSQLEEGTSQPGEVLADRAAKAGEVRIDELSDCEKKIRLVIHLYK